MLTPGVGPRNHEQGQVGAVVGWWGWAEGKCLAWEYVTNCSWLGFGFATNWLPDLDLFGASQVALVVKNSSANAGDTRDSGSIPGLGRFPGGGHDNLLQYSCLEAAMERSLKDYRP